jgi:hypothetical protein
MHLDAAGKVEASLNGRGNPHALFNGNHNSMSSPTEAIKHLKSRANGEFPSGSVADQAIKLLD